MLNLVRCIQQKENTVIETCHWNLQGLICRSREKKCIKRKRSESIYFYELLKGFFKLAQSVMPKCQTKIRVV